MAYFECLHELKLIVDLMYQGGLNYMRYSVSDTAEYGDYVAGPRLVTDATRAAMRALLGDIQSGRFARDWVAEHRAGRPRFTAARRADIDHVGVRLRALMPVLDAKIMRPDTGATGATGAASTATTPASAGTAGREVAV